MPLILFALIAVIIVCFLYLIFSNKKNAAKIDSWKELQDFRQEYQVAQGLFCSETDNEEFMQMVQDGIPLPDGIYEYKGGSAGKRFYTICAPDLSADEIAELLTYKKLGYLRTIKNCLVYFVALTIIGFGAYLIIISQSF